VLGREGAHLELLAEVHGHDEVVDGDFVDVAFHEPVQGLDQVVDEHQLFGLVGVELLHEGHLVEPVGKRALLVDAAHEPDLELLDAQVQDALVAHRADLLLVLEALFLGGILLLVLLLGCVLLFLLAVEFDILLVTTDVLEQLALLGLVVDRQEDLGGLEDVFHCEQLEEGDHALLRVHLVD